MEAGVKIKDLVLYGFSVGELSRIQEHVEKNKLEEVTPGFVQDCSDLAGKSTALMVTPHQVRLVCMEE